MDQQKYITRHYTVRGKERTLCELVHVVAVKARDNHAAATLRSGRYGAIVAAHDVFPGAPAQAPDFKSNAEKMAEAGWHFIAVTETGRLLLPREGHGAARILLTPTGDAMLDAGGLTVRFKPALSPEQCMAALNEAGLSVRHVLGFAPNLYLAHAPGGASGVGAASALHADERVEWAEPDLIEAWRHIPQRGLQNPRTVPGPR